MGSVGQNTVACARLSVARGQLSVDGSTVPWSVARASWVSVLMVQFYLAGMKDPNFAGRRLRASRMSSAVSRKSQRGRRDDPLDCGDLSPLCLRWPPAAAFSVRSSAFTRLTSVQFRPIIPAEVGNCVAGPGLVLFTVEGAPQAHIHPSSPVGLYGTSIQRCGNLHRVCLPSTCRPMGEATRSASCSPAMFADLGRWFSAMIDLQTMIARFVEKQNFHRSPSQPAHRRHPAGVRRAHEP